MGLGDLTLKNKEVIQGYAENDMNLSKTAVDMHHRKNTVAYHLEQIKKKTGLNPKVFYDLVELLDLLHGGNDNG